jgi:4-amino-4-deoxy-L-arabinose transferase-like glycosyltransferase
MREVYTWAAIGLIITFSTSGDVLVSHAMKRVGDLGELRRRSGLAAVVTQVLDTPTFLLGFACMVCGFFSLLFGLSWGDVSLIAPASASLTFVSNAIAAKLFLNEAVDKRRWAAAVLVAGGVALLAV